jgi:hypothetical protein
MDDADDDDARKNLFEKRIRTISSHIKEIRKSMNGTSKVGEEKEGGLSDDEDDN